MIQGRQIFTHRSLLALFFAVFFVDNLLIVIPNRFRSLQLAPNHVWDGFLICAWSGKLYSTFFAIALLFLCRKSLSKEDVGLTLRQNPGSALPTMIIVLALAAWGFLVGLSSTKGKPDLQTLVYLAVMPGLNEELVYRGYLMGPLDRLMTGKLRLYSATVGWGAVISSLLFGLMTGFWLGENLAVHLEMIALRNATIFGFIFARLRARTGSLCANSNPPPHPLFPLPGY